MVHPDRNSRWPPLTLPSSLGHAAVFVVLRPQNDRVFGGGAMIVVDEVIGPHAHSGRKSPPLSST